MSSAETDPSRFADESIDGSCTIRIQLWTIPIFAFHRPLQKNFHCPAFFPRWFFEQRNPYARTWLVRFHCRRVPQGLGAFGSGRMLCRPVRLRSHVHGEQDQRTASQVRRPHRRKSRRRCHQARQPRPYNQKALPYLPQSKAEETPAQARHIAALSFLLHHVFCKSLANPLPQTDG